MSGQNPSAPGSADHHDGGLFMCPSAAYVGVHLGLAGEGGVL